MKYVKNIFIALAHVAPQTVDNNILNGAKGAYVNVLCYAKNRLDFRNQTKKELGKMGIRLLRIEDFELVSERMKNNKIDDKLAELLQTINLTDSLKLGTFHTYQ